MYSDILNHTKTCLKCQQWKKSTDKLPLLQPIPTPDKPNIRIHADLFRPMLAAGRQHKIHFVHHRRFHEVHVSKEKKSTVCQLFSFIIFVILVWVQTH